MNNKIKTQQEKYKETGLGLIPEEWEVVRVKDIAKKMKAGGTPRKGVKEYWNGRIPFVLIEDMTSCELYISTTKETITEKGLKNSSAWLVPPNSLLLSMYATIGETAINTIPLATNQAILAIIPKNNFDVVFGAHLLKFNAERLKMQNIQSTQKNVNKGVVENFKIPLPPLQEQKAIAFVLSTIQTAKEKTEQVIQATKELKKSLMKHLFTYGPVSLEEVGKVKLKETEIGIIPEEWSVVNFETCIIKKKIQIGKIKQRQYKQFGKYPIVDQGQKLIAGYWDVDKDLYRGDLPVIIFGDHTRIIKFVDFPFVAGADGTKIIIPNSAIVNPLFFYYALLTIDIPSRGYNRHYSLLKEKKIPLPPLDEQKKIALILSAVDEKIQAEEDKKKALEELFKSMLHYLMTAKIRVMDLAVENV